MFYGVGTMNEVMKPSTSKPMNETLLIHPVGRVVTTRGKINVRIFPPFAKALDELSWFSRVIMVHLIDRNDTSDKRATLKVHQRENQTNPFTGVFVTRFPTRPMLPSRVKGKKVAERG